MQTIEYNGSALHLFDAVEEMVKELLLAPVGSQIINHRLDGFCEYTITLVSSSESEGLQTGISVVIEGQLKRTSMAEMRGMVRGMLYSIFRFGGDVIVLAPRTNKITQDMIDRWFYNFETNAD